MTQGNNPKFCDQCGNHLRETSKFCPECGVLIFKTSTQSPSIHPYDAQQEISSRVSDVEVDMERIRTIAAQKMREYGQHKPSSTIWNKMKRLTSLSRIIIITCLLLTVIYMFAFVFTKVIDDEFIRTELSKGPSGSLDNAAEKPLPYASVDETSDVSPIYNKLYETIDLSDLDKELRTIQDEYEKNPNRGPIYDEQMKQKWVGKKVHISGELYGLESNELDFLISDGKGRALCILEENQRPKLMKLNNNEKIHVTGTIQQIHHKAPIGTMDYYNKNIVKLIDCQVGHEKDRVTSK